MEHDGLGKVLVVGNPRAHSGKGAEAIAFSRGFFATYESATSHFTFVETTAPGDAARIAADAADFDTVVALGGDGIIHEAVCGLMELDATERPALGVIPVGTGNDYARTLGMARGDVQAALSQLIRAEKRRMDVGRVNGVHFMETLSFGLDAAIALDTTDRRSQGTGAKGTGLFVSSAYKIIARSSKGWICRADFDGDKRVLQEIILAVQVGPTYGAGFRICPGAKPDDGLLDVCFNTKIPSVPHALGLLTLARFGRHTSSKLLEFKQLRRMELDFDVEPPCQVDGEKLEGKHFSIEVVPAALDVLVP